MKLTVLAVFMAVFGFSTPAHAGFFSFFEKLFGGENTGAESITRNSQNVALLEGAINSNTLAGRGGGDIIIEDEKALLPNSGPMGTLSDIEEQNANPNKISIYVVREGDNLSQISEMFGISVNTIIWENNIKRGDLIKAGQTLVMLPVSGVRYKIKKGDTLAKIAKKFKAKVGEIEDFAANNLSEGKPLAEGETIIIPNGRRADVYTAYRSRRARAARGPLYAGYYMRPIRGGVKTQGLHGYNYNAVDLASSCGTPIVAAAGGNVIFTRDYGPYAKYYGKSYGNYVKIKHPNKTVTLYAHMKKIIVSNGWRVRKGQIIGYMGSTGRSTGCHVHFEIRGARNPF